MENKAEKTQELQILIKEIGAIQEEFRSELFEFTDTGKMNKAAMRRCRKRSSDLVKMYRDFRRNSVRLEKGLGWES